MPRKPKTVVDVPLPAFEPAMADVLQVSVDSENHAIQLRGGYFSSEQLESLLDAVIQELEHRGELGIRFVGDGADHVLEAVVGYARELLAAEPERCAPDDGFPCCGAVDAYTGETDEDGEWQAMPCVETPVPGVLEQALDIINGPRRASYGHPYPNHLAIARLWNAFLANKAMYQPGDLTPQEVGLMMDLLKTARLQFEPAHADSLLDKAGYVGCIDLMNRYEDR